MPHIKFTIGTDPEFFLKNEKGVFISAHDIVPGTKTEPYKMPDGSTIQADGTAVEIGTEPAETAKEFADKVNSSLNEARKMVPKQFSFCFDSYIKFTPAVFDKIPKESKALGCDPDWSVKFGIKGAAVLNKVADPGLFRTGSGHIHIGWTKNEDTKPEGAHFLDCATMIQNLDYDWSAIKGVLDVNYIYREKYYGAARAFRCKPYGVEYRTPSNAWLKYPDLYTPLAQRFLNGARHTAEGHYTYGYGLLNMYSYMKNVRNM